MTKSNSIIELAFAFDENYLLPFYVLLTSIFKNNNVNIFRIHIITTGINEDDKNQIRLFVNHYESTIIFYEIDKEFIKQFAVNNESRYPISVYYRLFFPYLISYPIKRILYLDIDTIVIKNLAYLANLKIENWPIGVAPDDEYFRPDIGIYERGKYFNTGVMILDLEFWKRLDLTRKSIDFLTRFPEKSKYHDQDALNYLLKDNWFELDNIYNVTYQILPKEWFNNSDFQFGLSYESFPTFVRKQYDAYLEDKIIIHFNHKFKPWIIGSYHPLKYLFNYYLMKFAEFPSGAILISKDFNFQFIYLINKLFGLESNELQTRLLLAFSLHIHWFKYVFKESEGFPDINILKEYYKSDNLISDQAYGHFDAEFKRNELILNEIYLQIMEGGFELENDYYELLGKWKNLCKNEILYLNRISGYNNITKIPDLINLQFGAYGTMKSLLNYFVLCVIESKG